MEVNMGGKMKKSTIVITIIIFIVLAVLLGIYAFLMGRSRQAEEGLKLTAVQIVLNRDLERDYPPTPKEVITYYTDLEKCFYNEECTEEEIEQLGMKARELYDDELLEANETEAYLARLKQEIKKFKDDGKKLTGANVAGSVNVDRFTEDGFEFARINCGYTILDGNSSTSVGHVYLLRRDENRRWKIYGWDNAQRLKLLTD